VWHGAIHNWVLQQAASCDSHYQRTKTCPSARAQDKAVSDAATGRGNMHALDKAAQAAGKRQSISSQQALTGILTSTVALLVGLLSTPLQPPKSVRSAEIMHEVHHRESGAALQNLSSSADALRRMQVTAGGEPRTHFALHLEYP
jgi:hypothetical protein